MKKIIIHIVLVCIFISCKQTEQINVLAPITNLEVDDSKYIINKKFNKGDVRRYGIYPNKEIVPEFLDNAIHLASKGLPITFIKGVYSTNIKLHKVENITLNFQDAIIAGHVMISDSTSKINITGRLTILDKLFIKESSNIAFNTVIVESDTTKNKYNKKNRGVSIYAGSKHISFNSLKIVDVGGDSDEFYKHSAAALQIHGWNNNPEYIQINSLEINNSARTALYITGANHKIKQTIITNFGIGSVENMFGLEDATPGEEKEFSGFWMNKCNNCEIDSLSINNTANSGVYSLRLDEGLYHNPSFINHINFRNNAKIMPIKDDVLTNILVKNEY